MNPNDTDSEFSLPERSRRSDRTAVASPTADGGQYRGRVASQESADVTSALAAGCRKPATVPLPERTRRP